MISVLTLLLVLVSGCGDKDVTYHQQVWTRIDSAVPQGYTWLTWLTSPTVIGVASPDA